MRLLQDMPIGRKLLVIIMVTTSVVLLLASIAIVAYDSEIYQTTVQNDLDALAQIIADNSTAALTFESPQDAQETLASLRARPNLVQACIYTNDFTVFARYARPGGPSECPQPPQADLERFTEDGLLMFRSILLNNEKLGTLYFQYDIAHVIAARRRLYSGFVGIIALGSFLAVLIFSSRLRRLISDPIVGLAERARVVSQTKDYGIRAEKQTQDEVGSLVDAFNEMLANIQSRDTELLRARDELDRRVRERTAELRQSEERFRLLVRDVREYAILTLDLEGRVASWNDGAERINGYKAEEIIGRHFSCFYPPEDVARGKPAKLLQLALAEGRAGDEDWRVRKDGSRFWANVVITALKDDTGQLRGFSKITRDYSDRKQAEEALKKQAAELARSNADLEQFAYVASHDLQEPLRMVISFMQLLEKRYRGKLDADADEFIGFAVDGATRMKQLISDLLTYSRVSTSLEEPAPTDCEMVLLNVMTNLGLSLQESGAVVTHDPLPTVHANYSQTVQLLQNLVANAVKFRGPQPPRVHISALRTRTEWVFSVSDNGIGISPEHCERIFVIFQRLHDRISYPGTGIGLAICKKIVERHGGRIWVESTSGEGSTFFFTIPAAEPPAKGAGHEYHRDQTTTNRTTAN